MPNGKRKEGLYEVLTALRIQLLTNPTLSFDGRSAEIYAQLSVEAQTKGIQISIGDAQIAAIAKQHGYLVATRDTAPFLAAGVDVINPWEDR